MSYIHFHSIIKINFILVGCENGGKSNYTKGNEEKTGTRYVDCKSIRDDA